jgi:hypothetical protein
VLFGKKAAPVEDAKKAKKSKGKKGSAETTTTATGGLQGKKNGSKKGNNNGDAADYGMDRVNKVPTVVEMLAFKKVTPGSLFLCAVKSIGTHHLTVSLPFNLTGMVKLDQVSDEYFQALNGADGPPPAMPPLKDTFTKGQLIHCYVLELSAGNSKHVELSMRASLFNSGLSLDQCETGCTIYGTVRSVEDHGYVLSMGLSGTAATGFLPLEERYPKATKGGAMALRALTVGEPLLTKVVSINTSSNVLKLTRVPHMVANAKTKGAAMALQSIKPGALVTGNVEKVLPNGLFVSFCGVFSGTVHCNHLAEGQRLEWETAGAYEKGGKLKLRVLSANYDERVFQLSALTHIVELRGMNPLVLPLKRHTVLAEATVERLVPGFGVVLSLPVGALEDASPEERKSMPPAGEDRLALFDGSAASGRTVLQPTAGTAVLGFAHISQLSDTKVRARAARARAARAATTRAAPPFARLSPAFRLPFACLSPARVLLAFPFPFPFASCPVLSAQQHVLARLRGAETIMMIYLD